MDMPKGPAGSRRDILKGGSAVVLSVAMGAAIFPRHAAAAAQMTAHERELYEAAKQEGELTWYTAHSDDVTAQALGRGFEANYPGIRVSVVRTTAQVAFQRVSQELRAGAMQVDVLSSTDIGHYVYLKEKQLLEQFVPENAGKVLEIYQHYDPDGYYFVTSAGLIGMAYNTEKLKLYGWKFFEELVKNNPQIGRSINDAVTMLNAGERVVAGTGPFGTAGESAQKGNPLALIYPTDGCVLILAPSGIMKGTKHPNAARLLMEYLLSVDASKVWVDHFGEPMRPEVSPPSGVKSAKDLKTIRPSVEEIFKGIPEVIKQWRETFGV